MVCLVYIEITSRVFWGRRSLNLEFWLQTIILNFPAIIVRVEGIFGIAVVKNDET